MTITQDDKNAQVAAKKEDYFSNLKSLTVEVGGNTYQAGSESINAMLQCLLMTDLPSDFYWVDSNDNRVSVTQSELQSIYDAAMNAKEDAYMAFQDEKVRINSCTTIDELFEE